MYWAACTQAKGHKFACLFSEFQDIEKWVKSLESNNSLLPNGSAFEFYQSLKDNLNIRCFEDKNSARLLVDNFIKD